ncbi:MAG TPA: DmsC/YnfH family molybdoenzyme membrane anchor subunit [Verrucomicrobiae bacterium]|nr:DmsC/YnfH family molybdoenzyme membrane anchor subunit [Verrucomicrobiae bacterium]
MISDDAIAVLPVNTQPQAAPDNGRTLIDDLLAEQRRLTAVEKFSQRHDRDDLPPLDRHYRDLIPLATPTPGKQFAFEVDLDKCSGCKACVTACHSLNGLDEGESWRDVGTLVSDDWRRPFQQTVTTACHHCVDPGCLNGCPVLAYEKDPVTGIVRHLDDQCIGCQYCILKCPYDVPKYSVERGIVRKCDLCSQRLAAGEAPACVQACPNEAIRITIVDQQKVSIEFRQRTNDANPFLPAAPEPGVTIPTTRYVSKKPLPPDLIPADAAETCPQPPHWPLVWMLTLTQFGVGAFALLPFVPPGARPILALVGFIAVVVGLAASMLHLGKPLKAWRSFLGLRKSWLSREIVVFALFSALAFSTTTIHWASSPSFPLTPALSLGEREDFRPAADQSALPDTSTSDPNLFPSHEPSEAPPGFGVRQSSGAFVGVGRRQRTAALQDAIAETTSVGDFEALTRTSGTIATLLSLTTALIGFLGVFCSAMVYHDTHRVFWRGLRSIGKFFGTTAVLGLAAAWLAAELNEIPTWWLPAALILAATIKLAGEHRLLRRAGTDIAERTFPKYAELDEWSLARSAVLMRDPLGLVTRTRFFLGFAGGVVLPLLSFLAISSSTLLAAGALLICALAELAERYVFFRAVVPPKMPGAI